MVNKEKSKQEGKSKLKPKEKLLKYLIENKQSTSIRNLSKATLMDYKNTYNIINKLQSEGIIIKEIMGNTTPIRINLKINKEIYNVEEKRTKEFLSKNPKLKVVKKYIEELNYPFLIVLLFGSYAKGMETKSSDIDICIISDNKHKINKLHEALNLLSLRLEIQEFATKEFISMIEKRQNNLGHEIVKNNVILYGIENYYNLISKWMKKE